MQLEAKALLHDMLDAASLLEQFTAGKSWELYRGDAFLRSAVERQFEIVGEAMTSLAKLDPSTAARITDHRKIISFRNVLIHGYAKVNHAVTWQIVQDDLPVLLRELRALLIEPDKEPEEPGMKQP